MDEIIRWVVFGLGILVLGYALARGFWFAYFRSKLEHHRAVMRELRKEEHDDGI